MFFYSTLSSNIRNNSNGVNKVYLKDSLGTNLQLYHNSQYLNQPCIFDLNVVTCADWWGPLLVPICLGMGWGYYLCWSYMRIGYYLLDTIPQPFEAGRWVNKYKNRADEMDWFDSHNKFTDTKQLLTFLVVKLNFILLPTLCVPLASTKTIESLQKVIMGVNVWNMMTLVGKIIFNELFASTWFVYFWSIG